jgi:hypothetical protein
MTRRVAVQHEYAIHSELRTKFCGGVSWRQDRTSPEWYAVPLADIIAVVQSYVDHLDESYLLGLA